MKKTFKHLELFSGIGGFRKAIDLYCKDNDLISKCVGFSEIDKYALTTYKSNYNTLGEKDIGDIDRFTSDIENIKLLEDFDILSAGFPCQAFSMMGNKKGFDDCRGNLFYNIINILLVKQPKYALLENVRNIKTHDGGRTYTEILRSLNDDAGYFVTSNIFNTADFGLPQTRRRMIFLAIRNDLIDRTESIDLCNEEVKSLFSELNHPISLKKYDNVLDGVLERNVEKKYYLSERIKPTILSDGSKNFKSKSDINQMIARPLTATMVKMHRACQDNYYSDEFINTKNHENYIKKFIPKHELIKMKIRKITPLEALRLQGFDESFYQNACESGVSNHQLYKQAGNAVSVNTIYAVLNFLFNKKIIEM